MCVCTQAHNYVLTYSLISEFTCSCVQIFWSVHFLCTYVYLLTTYSCMHIFSCTYMYLCVSLLIRLYFNTRRYVMYVIRSLNVRLIADLHRGYKLCHTAGRKWWGTTWKWRWGQDVSYYTSWAAGEPNGNGNYLYLWNRGKPAWSTWDDDVDRKTCAICEHIINVPSYC